MNNIFNIDIYEIPKGNANAKCFYESKEIKIICSVYFSFILNFYSIS